VLSLHVDTGRGWRGGQSQVFNTVLGLREAGHRALLVAPPGGELFRRMLEGHDVLPLTPRSDVDLGAAWTLSRVLKQLRPDVVHAHDPHAISMAATAASIVGGERPVLVASRRGEFRIARNSFSRWKYSQVDCYIATCGAVRERLVVDGIPRERIAVVHDGVDVERIARLQPANVHAEFYLPARSPIVGNVAALAPHKGHHHLIEAAALVLRDVPDARFVIIGDGELRAALERQVQERHLTRHIVLAGFRADVLELTRGFDVFATSPIHEGMCLALVDAMAAGKPAVATRAGGIPEVMVDGETGFLVDVRDAATLAARIVALLRDEELRSRMGAAAQERAASAFSVKGMVQGVAGVYEEALRRGNSRSRREIRAPTDVQRVTPR
jgi:glycosyltransferase involved in cell wall biosynthesis